MQQPGASSSAVPGARNCTTANRTSTLPPPRLPLPQAAKLVPLAGPQPPFRVLTMNVAHSLVTPSDYWATRPDAVFVDDAALEAGEEIENVARCARLGS